ncbi:MAG: hypothetical protein WA373_12365 [Burkholderiales bacterium]
MFQIADLFKAIPRVLLTVVLVAAGLVAVLVAWWIAVILILAFALYIAVRRMLPRKPPPSPEGGSAIIEGEYRVEDESRIEREHSPPRSRDRSGS